MHWFKKKKKWTHALRVCLPAFNAPTTACSVEFGTSYIIHTWRLNPIHNTNEMMTALGRIYLVKYRTSQDASSHWCKGSSVAVMSWTHSCSCVANRKLSSLKRQEVTFSIFAGHNRESCVSSPKTKHLICCCSTCSWQSVAVGSTFCFFCFFLSYFFFYFQNISAPLRIRFIRNDSADWSF